QLELQISADEWTKMQPKNVPMGGPGGGPPPGMRPPREDGDKDKDKGKDKGENPQGPQQGPPRGPGGPGMFGFDFTYVSGTFVADGESVSNIGIRFKGNSSYMMSARGLKHPFHLDFNRFDEEQTFRGLKALSLSNNAMDESYVREMLAYDCFRTAGVPCSHA